MQRLTAFRVTAMPASIIWRSHISLHRPAMSSSCCGHVGMINGQLFKKVVANSPGGILADTTQGKPPVFISAGLQDNIFPVQQAGNAVRCPCCSASSGACLQPFLVLSLSAGDCRILGLLFRCTYTDCCMLFDGNSLMKIGCSAGCLLLEATGLYGDIRAVQRWA